MLEQTTVGSSSLVLFKILVLFFFDNLVIDIHYILSLAARNLLIAKF